MQLTQHTQILLQPDLEVINAVCQVVVVPEEGKTVTEAVLDFFEAHGKTRKLLEWAVTKEINNSSKC